MYHPESHPTPAGYAIEEVLRAFQETHPHFPDLTFREFVDLCCEAASIYDRPDLPRFGLYTHSFMQFHFVDPAASLGLLDQRYAESGRYRKDMFNVDFILTHNLNQQLHDYLLANAYEAEDLKFILTLGRILPQGLGRSEDQDWNSYYDRDLNFRISRLDAPIFAMFPEFAP